MDGCVDGWWVIRPRSLSVMDLSEELERITKTVSVSKKSAHHGKKKMMHVDQALALVRARALSLSLSLCLLPPVLLRSSSV